MANMMTQLNHYLPHWMTQKTVLLSNIHWIGIILVLIVSYVLERLCRQVVLKRALSFATRYGIGLKEDHQKKINLPIAIILLALFIYVGVHMLGLPPKTLHFFVRATRVALTFGGVLAVYNLVDLFGIYFHRLAENSDNKIDDILVPLIQKSVKFFVVAVGIVFIGDSMALDMKSVIAGLGIGGLAFAFAAKDTLANFFGSLMIVLDRPFGIGDWISVNGIEGAVMEVGLRSTRLRTAYDSVISIPNGSLTNVNIDNYGLRNYRRFRTHIGVQYNTPPEKLEAFCEGIRRIVLAHEFTRKDNFQVYFNEFADSSLNILVNIYWAVPGINEELTQRHLLLMDILKLGNEMGVEFAFPTQTVHLFNEKASQIQNISEDPLLYGNKKAEEILKKSYTFSNTRSSDDMLR